MRKNSIKNTRINGEVQKELSKLITTEIKDPRISPLTSVVAVEVAPDLKTAKVYVSVLGNEEVQQDTLRGLKSAAPFMRSQLAKNINLRNTPELKFVIDQSIEYGVNMSKLIHDVNKDLQDKEEIITEDEDFFDKDDFEEEDFEDEDFEDEDFEEEDDE